MKYLETKDIIWTKEFVQNNLDRIKDTIYNRDAFSFRKLDSFSIYINDMEEELVILLDKFEYINWRYCSITKDLKLNLIEKFQHKVSWTSISIYNDLMNDEFVRKFSHKLFLIEIFERLPDYADRPLSNLSLEFRKELNEKISNLKLPI